MHVIAAKTLRDYALKYKDAAAWLMTFLERVEAAKWSSIADVRRIYPHAHAVKVRSGNEVFVFNACGNSYRLLTAIHFNRGKVYILRFLTHAEYDKDPFGRINYDRHRKVCAQRQLPTAHRRVPTSPHP